MGDVNQILFIEKHIHQLRGPYLEVGAKDYGSTQDLRSLVASDQRYTGVDLEAGPGVDVVVDLAKPFDEVDAKLEGARFGTIFCLSVLEHCRRPFVMADNLTRLLEPGGRLCISVPFAWKFHGYPSDYWRFTHEGVKILFPRLAFDPAATVWATSRKGDLRPIDEQIGRIPFSSKAHRQQGHVFRGIVAKILQSFARIGILRWLAGYPYVLAPANIFMIGTRA